jgi:hypothetical protein
MNTSSSTDSRVARESGASVTPASWDPYEVWLTRVKLPRELVRRRQVPHVAAAPAAKPEAKPETGNGSSPEPSLA